MGIEYNYIFRFCDGARHRFLKKTNAEKKYKIPKGGKRFKISFWKTDTVGLSKNTSFRTRRLRELSIIFE